MAFFDLQSHEQNEKRIDETYENDSKTPIDLHDYMLEEELAQMCDLEKTVSINRLRNYFVVKKLVSEKSYVCKRCKKAFSRIENLKRHERIHTGERPFVCQICTKAFNDLSSLKRHKQLHTGEKPYVCEICTEAFSQLDSLQYHKRIHTGEKPFSCQICKTNFITLGSLKIHERIHTGEKPFVCKICTKGFSCSGTLNRHERIHTGQLPYICNVCSKAFNRRSNMLRHQRTHTEQKRRNYKLSKKASSKVDYKNIVMKESYVDMSTSKVFMEKRPKNSSFEVNLFGCGFCGEMFAEEDHFLMHCSHHSDEGDFPSDLMLPCQRTEFNEILKERFSISDLSKQLGKEAVTGSSLRWFGHFRRFEDSVHSVSLQ